jgi:D-sedoheptulose 7-phosphate isomerase
MAKNKLELKNKINFLENYRNNTFRAYKNVDFNTVSKIIDLLDETIKRNNKIFVAGNGGSASVSNHMMCDFIKGIKTSNKKKLPKVISLSNSIETITAISNDINYDMIFSYQLENYYEKGDCLICFSSSGQSKNIINAIKYANKKKIATVLIQGFGLLNKKIQPNYHVNINYNDYGITEDIFSSLMHAISQYIGKH